MISDNHKIPNNELNIIVIKIKKEPDSDLPKKQSADKEKPYQRIDIPVCL
jgi:hypothetical protein